MEAKNEAQEIRVKVEGVMLPEPVPATPMPVIRAAVVGCPGCGSHVNVAVEVIRASPSVGFPHDCLITAMDRLLAVSPVPVSNIDGRMVHEAYCTHLIQFEQCDLHHQAGDEEAARRLREKLTSVVQPTPVKEVE